MSGEEGVVSDGGELSTFLVAHLTFTAAVCREWNGSSAM